MNGKAVAPIVLVVSTLILAAGLLASNMGFKLPYQLAGPGDATSYGISANGTNTIGVPFNPDPAIVNASDLYNDIGSARVLNLQRWDPCGPGLVLYPPNNFPIQPGEGYFVRMASGQGFDYVIVGAHDPTFGVTLAGPGQPLPCGASATGTNYYAYAYHSVSVRASELANELGSANVQNIQRYNETGFMEIYSPGGGTDFPLEPGEAYFIRIKSGLTLNYIPAHY